MNDAYLPSQEAIALVSASPNAILLLSPGLTVVAASEAGLHVLGASNDEIVGQDIRQVLAGSDSLDALIASANAAVRTRQPHQMTPGLFRTAAERHQRLLEILSTPVVLGGATRWVLQQVKEPPQPGEGQAEHPALEKALQVAEAQLRSIMRTIPDAMIIIDERGRIEALSTTAERLFGYTAD